MCTPLAPSKLDTLLLLWFGVSRWFNATNEYATNSEAYRLLLAALGKEEVMLSKRHWLNKAKTFLIELTAFVSLLLVLARIIITEWQHLFR